MEVRVAESAGFCFGVERAVSLVEHLLAEGKKPLYTYGPIIHNDQVVGSFAERGVRVLADLKEAVAYCAEHAKDGDNVLLSPACASWDMFKSYEQRGELFKEYVNEL